MVTSTAIVESEVASRTGVKVALPKANAAGAVTKRRTDPVLTVTKNNELYLFNRKIDPPISKTRSTRHSRKWIRKPCFCAATRASSLAPPST
jgi:biopolymer transport protein ExbD